MKRVHRMPFGARLGRRGTRFQLWAPGAAAVELCLGAPDSPRRLPMRRRRGGWYALEVADAGAGVRYAYRVDGGLTVPDPASRANPDGVHAASVVVDSGAYDWHDGAWRGRPWHEAVVYEMHVGTFTPEGTFAAAASRLAALADLGVTAVELMPVAAFPGSRNWGYDGVLPFAPAACYGAGDDLKRLVEVAHARGLMVLLDVVYNHFGPEGNYLHVYAPAFLRPRHHTPWGAAVNFDGEGSRTVREFYVHNALYWLNEFHFDGLRLDAVHAIADDSQPDFVTELAQRAREGVHPGRQVHLVLENDRNDARYLRRDGNGAPPLATAQWNDDLHHAAHVIATGEADGYYADYATDPVSALGRALAEGFVYQGQASPYRGGAARGTPSTSLPACAFVAFLQDHDQVGNRALGERLSVLAPAELVAVLTACVLLAPQVPMLFMGEEFAATTPFLYFCDFRDELARAVRDGRRDEFARFERFRTPEARAAIPDPNDPATFAASKLDWHEARRPAGTDARALIGACLAARRAHVEPLLPGIVDGGTYAVAGGTGLHVQWSAGTGQRLHLLANFGALSVAMRLPEGLRVLCVPADLPSRTATFPARSLAVVLAEAA